MLNLGRFEAVGTVPSKTWSILYLNIFDFSYVFMACPRACPRSLILSCQGCVAKLGKKEKKPLNYWFYKTDLFIPSPFNFKVKCAGFWNSICHKLGPSVFLPSLSPHHTSSCLLMSKLWWFKDWLDSFNFQVLVLKSRSLQTVVILYVVKVWQVTMDETGSTYFQIWFWHHFVCFFFSSSSLNPCLLSWRSLDLN